MSFSPSTYQDDGNAIAVSCRTDLIDFNSNQKKFMSSLIVVGDKYTSTNNVTVFKYDDNYNTVNFLGIVDMSSFSGQLSIDVALFAEGAHSNP